MSNKFSPQSYALSDQEKVANMINVRDASKPPPIKYSKIFTFVILVLISYCSFLLIDRLVDKSFLVRLVEHIMIGSNSSKNNKSFFEYYSASHNKMCSAESFNVENIYLETDKGHKIGAYLITNPNSTLSDEEKELFVVCHGNAGNRVGYSYGYGLRERVVEYPNSVFLILDYSGFGDSEGTFDMNSVAIDVKAGFDHLNKRYPGNKGIRLIGHSLGSLIALKYCEHVSLNYWGDKWLTPIQVVLFSPFATTLSVLKHNIFYRFASFLIPTLNSNIKRQFFHSNIALFNFLRPNFLVFHGENDSVIPPSESRDIMDSLENSDLKNNFYFLKERDHFNILNLDITDEIYGFKIWDLIMKLKTSKGN